VLEYARNVLGIEDAQHAEVSPGARRPVIAPLACSLVEVQDRVLYVEGSRLREWVGVDETVEGFHCSYGLNRAFESLFDGTSVRIAARGPGGEVRAIELISHPFFLGTLFQPERHALAGSVHPVIAAFLRAAEARP
jgi:CTP synthase (UTP-ammonia lyase)